LTLVGKIGNKIKLLHCGIERRKFCNVGAGINPVMLMSFMFNMAAFAVLSCREVQARSSVGERFLDTEEVGSSILPVPTILN
jgi:hypothetical protein